ncbi:hypothetical protein PDIG_86710 [Penicillium digitatum PHI26]|uniref:O-methyltransferase n=2 Tax=Penicillium digitatum TaxID=36651 RepID=K9F6D2_PEND2|nr:hypothetical protein PDIP_32720 [Penicillium digitatum Pd1]EKV04870.1 hypothetical protein PDIG_86710 [Penicillium digitatum PHI26]EKV17136.1 hypothetical protein PDIP_32720 [Penicillium digitatum Pd1]
MQFRHVSYLHWLYEFDIFHLIPPNERINYADLAAAAKVPEQRLESIIRIAMTNSLFREQPYGKSIVH